MAAHNVDSPQCCFLVCRCAVLGGSIRGVGSCLASCPVCPRLEELGCLIGEHQKCLQHAADYVAHQKKACRLSQLQGQHVRQATKEVLLQDLQSQPALQNACHELTMSRAAAASLAEKQAAVFQSIQKAYLMCSQGEHLFIPTAPGSWVSKSGHFASSLTRAMPSA